MIIRIIMFIAGIMVFCLCALLMYGELKSNRRKIDRSVKKEKRQYASEYGKIYK